VSEISIVIPFYNEEECVEPVLEEMIAVFSGRPDTDWEIIMVNDGSNDATAEMIDRFAEKNDRLQAVHLPFNCGQSAALEAGFNIAKGDILGMMDGDGQNDPNDFPKLLEALELQNVDMMCGIRANRSDTSIRKFSSRIANRFRSFLLKDDIIDIGCSIRIFRSECLSKIILFRNAHRFFPSLLKMKGFSVLQMPVNHRPRLKGSSKYGVGINSRLWVGIVDLAGVYWLSRRLMKEEILKGKSDEICS
jgi:dolichol-phosphate mannosyltransferase